MTAMAAELLSLRNRPGMTGPLSYLPLNPDGDRRQWVNTFFAGSQEYGIYGQCALAACPARAAAPAGRAGSGTTGAGW
jgi:hypothetical protein